MKKNLVYYCLGLNPLYSDIFKKSLESLDKSNPEIFDVLIITNQDYHEKYLSNLDRKNLFFLYVDDFKNGDDICFSKLKIFEWDEVYKYENLFMADSDVLFNINLNNIFDKCEDTNKLYAPIEDYSFENHRRIYFGLGDYKDEDIEFFRQNNIHTFNCGTYMLKNSIEMRKHFSNVWRIIRGHRGDYFSDQSFMNHYFNRMKLVDYNVLNHNENLFYVVEENVNLIKNFENKIFHFLGNTYYGEDKLEKMTKVLNKIKTNNKVYITKMSDDRKTIYFFCNENMKIDIDVRIEMKTIYKTQIDVLAGVTYWISLNDGFHNKTFEFYNETFSQIVEVNGTIQSLIDKIKKVKLSNEDKEMASFLDRQNSFFYPRRKDFFNYYSSYFEKSKNNILNILEINSSKNTYNSLQNFFSSSKIHGTIFSLKEFENCPECDFTYFDNRTSKLLEPLKKLNGKESFDIIISPNGDLLSDNDVVDNILYLMKPNSLLFCEEISINDLPNINELLSNKISKYELNFISLENQSGVFKNLLELKKTS